MPKKIPTGIKKKIIHAIDKFKNIISLEKILKLFSITIYKYQIWKNQIKHLCIDSPLTKCFKIIPNQLTVSETNKIKELCMDQQFKGWPIYAIAKYVLFNNILSVSINTWYKYVKILQLQNILPESKRKKHRIGIRAVCIHELWHVDVTIFRTMDNIKSYIYLIVDNYSRFILAFKVSLNIKAAICFDNLKAAYEKYLKPNENEKTVVTNVMTDGGCENNGLENVSDFIKKIIAQTDIEFSNSMIEAVNKTLKYRHLFQEPIQDFETLERKLEKFIFTYNNRPHTALNGLTPQQVLNGETIDFEKIKKQIESSRIKRIEDNRKYNCGLC